MCRTSKPVVASHTGGLGCVCTLTELIFGSLRHVHKLTVRTFIAQISDLLLSQPPDTPHAPTPFIHPLPVCWRRMQVQELQQPAGPAINAPFKGQ